VTRSDDRVEALARWGFVGFIVLVIVGLLIAWM